MSTAKLRELDSRDLTDGSSISITLFHREGTDEYIVEAMNDRWASSIVVHGDESEGWEAFLHPFSREGWMDYPGVNTTSKGELRPLSPSEHALLEAYELVNEEAEVDA